jgi:hypothetical protein
MSAQCRIDLDHPVFSECDNATVFLRTQKVDCEPAPSVCDDNTASLRRYV